MASNDQIFEQLIIDESASLRRSSLVYQIVGRVLFTGIALLLSFLSVPAGHRLPLTIFIAFLGAAWWAESFILSRRSRVMSRLIVEANPSDYSNWVSLFVKSHHYRYGDWLGVLFTEFHLAEPLAWVALALWLLSIG